MAKPLDYDPFQPFSNGTTYDRIFDGAAYELKRGQDYEQATSTVVQKIRDEYEDRFGSLLLRADGDRVYIKVVHP